MMEDFITNGVKGIAVCGINLEALKPAIKKANEAGIPVVMFNTITELDGVEVYAYSGYNQYNGGGKIADWVNEKMNGEAKVAIIEGLPSDYTTQRMGGFVDKCKEAYPGIEVVATQPGDWVREKGMNAAMDMIQAHPEINVIYGLSDEMALGAVQACKQLNRDDIICIGLDGNPNAKEAVKAGELDGTLDCGPVAIGANAIKALADAIDGVARDEKIIEAETIVYKVKAGKEGKLFGSVSTGKITELLKEQFNVTVDKKKFVDNDNITVLGKHNVRIELYKGVIATVKLDIQAQ
jgi:ribose transport system substrate-binding protein